MEPNDDFSDPVMSIGTLADKVGLSVSAVRKYENECRQCVVYRFGSLCTERIKSLVHDQDGSQNASAAIRELIDHKRRSKKTCD